MKKKVATWHKKKTTPKSPDAAHWVESRAKLTKILEASGMTPEKQKTMLPCNRDR